MNFIVYFTIPSFFKALARGCTVYTVAYSEGKPSIPPAPNTNGLVLFTSDAGVAGSAIRVLQINLTDEGNALELANTAQEKLGKFFIDKGLRVQEGVLLTAGLQDALRYWGKVAPYSLAELDDLIKTGEKVTLE